MWFGPQGGRKPLDVAAIDDELRTIAQSLPQGYTPIDAYRDFRAVFGTEQGKRVLAVLLNWTRVMRRSATPGTDSHTAFYHEGERSIGLKVLITLNQEPSDLPKGRK